MAQNSTLSEQMEVLNRIHHVDDFDPSVFAVEYSDLGNGESRKRIPVMVQIAWFRLKYPEGKIAITVEQKPDCFVASARVYPSYKDPESHYLAEATASRSLDPEKPSISPREWAQTAAVGVALRNAGFGVQFNAAGDEFPTQAPIEFTQNLPDSHTDSEAQPSGAGSSALEEMPVPVPVPVELTAEQQYEQDLNVLCPISKFRGMTLREVLHKDPGALNWLATKYSGNPEVSAAAKRICEYAVQQASA